MSKEISLFQNDFLSMKEKFYIFMDLLITNQVSSQTECIIFISISYLQIISGFFAEQVGVFNSEYTSDKILFYLERLFRLSDLFIDKYSEFKIIIICILVILIIFSIYFFILFSKTKINSLYTYKELFINYFFKCFIYIGYNMILDLVFSNFCFGENQTNPFFKGVSCKIKDNLEIVIISLILLIITIVLIFCIQIFYFDSHFLSNSFYARISCYYEIYLSLNSIIYSIFLIEAQFLSKEIFLIYNLIISSIFMNFYLKYYLFYDSIINTISGLFHILYLWTSIFCLIFAYINFEEKGVIYLVSSSALLYFYFSLKIRFEEKIFLDTPFYKIKNKAHFLYYIKNILDKINHIKENPEEKAILGGIMHMHSLECPNPNCISKHKERLYLPMTNEWSDRTKPNVEDKVFLMNFIIIIMNYFIGINVYSPDMLINLSFYYLEIIGNYCLSIYYYRKAKQMKLTLQEQFSLKRLKIRISKALTEKLKSPNEECSSIEDLNVTIYFKYTDLSEKFIDEINNDINLSLEFWRIFEKNQIDSKAQIDYNEVFSLTNKIRMTKEKIENFWIELIKIYNGVNDLFNLYSEYVEQIIDDDLKKRDLEEIKRKNDNFSEQLSQNYYSILFNKETGIIIANGDKGKEGLIEKTNSEAENIFKYKANELKGKNLNVLMPKIYSKVHINFMKKYYDIGEKIAIDKNDLKTFGKDKENSIIMIKIIIKLFPILNENIYFIGIISKENIDDIIFIDSNFNIQGASSKIMKILKLNNNLLFQDNEIPFYVICKQFVNFYKIFLQGKKQNEKENKKSQSILIDSQINEDDEENEIINKKRGNDKKELQENIEINENIELEYEILLPQFLREYSDSSRQTINKEKINIMVKQDSFYEPDDSNINESIDESGESDLLVTENEKNNFDYVNEKKSNKNIVRNNINTPISNSDLNTNNPTPTPNITPTPAMNTNSNKKKTQNKNNRDSITTIIENNTLLNSKIEEYKEEYKKFTEKIKKYRDLFESKHFTELNDFIDRNNNNNNSQVFKFNFTFDRIKIGHQDMAYLIRCIDNKIDGVNDDEESIDNADPKITQYKKEKADSIKPLYEIFDEEKKNIMAQTTNFYTLSVANKTFQNLLDLCRQDINKMSMVHGQKKDEIMDDENSSQTSQTGFNSDLVRKERIEEIKANLLNNISNFYTLKYIKISVFLISLFTVLYGIIYLILFSQIYNDLKEVNKLNIDLFLISSWLTSLTGTLISLRTMYLRVEQKENYTFNSFIDDNEEYFNTMKIKCFCLYNNITTSFGNFEHKIGKYLNKDKFDLFWSKEKKKYYYNDLIDYEPFPAIISQILSNVNSILFNQYFNLNNFFPSTDDSKNLFEYINYNIIENSYNILIPSQYLKIQNIPSLLKNYNGSSRNILFVFLLIYAFLMVIFCVFYSLLIFLTNENMGEGLKKISKIKLDKIEETIKKIEDFNEVLKDFIQLERKSLMGIGVYEKSNIDMTVSKIHYEYFNEDSSMNSSSGINGFNSEQKISISLKVLTSAYLQTGMLFCILCACLIPIYLLTNYTVISSNKLIDIENYFFGKIIVSGASLLKIKCKLSECQILQELDYSGIVSTDNFQKIIQGISLFSKLSEFYNENYLLNVCKAVFIQTSEEYEDCLYNDLIKSANNADSLLKLTEEIVQNLNKDINIYEGNYYNLSNGDYVEFKKYYLYESILFRNLEEIYYEFLVPISENFAQICLDSLNNYLKDKRKIVFLLTSIFFIMVISQCIYISFCFIKKVINLIGVSRCILKIIPTTLISTTQELEIWMEDNKT